MTSDLLEENQELRKQVAELEKENAELKEAVKHFNPCGEWNDDVHECEFRHYAIEYGSKLAIAKEIIKKLVEAIHIWDCKNLEKVETEAEQFLNSEVEK